MTTTIQTIEILNYETNPIGQRQELKEREVGAYRWQYSFPFWLDYALEPVPSAKGLPIAELEAHRAKVDEMAYPLRCDFTDVCEWALDKGMIEDYSIEPKEGWVLIPGTCDVRWSPEKQDAVETHRGRYFMTFEQFLREYLDEKDLIEFVTNYLSLKEK